MFNMLNGRELTVSVKQQLLKTTCISIAVSGGLLKELVNDPLYCC
jgi:hypothetical protein